MAQIVAMDPPARRLGRTRLSADDIHAIAEIVSLGGCAGDGETVRSYQTAYNRARSAARRVRELGVPCVPHVWPRGTGYTWGVETPK